MLLHRGIKMLSRRMNAQVQRFGRRNRRSSTCLQQEMRGLPVFIESLETRALLSSVITVGDHTLLPNTANQVIEVRATGDSQVSGLNVRAQIGDGTGAMPEPVFNGASFSGGIWDAHPNSVTGGPIPGFEQFLQSSVVFNSSADSVVPNGLVVKLLVDTTGFSTG